MFKFRIGKVITSLTLFSVYLVPLVGSIDFFMSIGILPGMADRSRSLHPFPQIVLIREILITLLLILLMIKVFKNIEKVQKILLYTVFLLVPLLLSSINFPAFMSGFRQILYFVYVPVGFFIYNYARKDNINIIPKICRSLKIVLVVECILSLLQLKFMPAAEGMSHFGPRVLGSFNNPNTLGVFGATALLILILLSEERPLYRFYYICAVIIVVGSGTRTAAFLLACVLLGSFFIRIKPGMQRRAAAVVMVIILFFMIAKLNVIANKPAATDYIWKGDRVQNIRKYIASVGDNDLKLLFGYGWGVMTSWFFTLGGDRYLVGLFGLDSFYAVILAQIGLIGLGVFIIYLFWLFSHAGKKGLVLFLFFCLIGGQINVLEYYPINLLIFLALGILIAKRRSDLKQCPGYFSTTQSIGNNVIAY